MSSLLYNDEELEDLVNVLAYINDFTKGLGITPALLDPAIVQRVVRSCKLDFPYEEGISKASAFKKVANFVCHFVAERPMTSPFPAEIIGPELAKIDNHQNAMVAFAIAVRCLNGSTIRRKDGAKAVSNPIEYSLHSYVDIIDALSILVAQQHWKLVAVLFEQLVYKTNKDCQYDVIKTSRR